MVALMYFLLSIFLVLIILGIKHILRPLKKINGKTWTALSFILLFFLTIYWFFVPNIHRIYGDEPTLVTAAANYSGNIIENAPLLAIFHIVFLVFGFSNIAAIKCNIVISIFNLFLLFYLLHLLFRNRHISIMALVFLAVSRSYITYATGSYNIIAALMFVLMSSIFFWLYIKYDKVVLNLLFVLSVYMASMIRVEYILLVPLYFAWWIIIKKNKIKMKNWLYLLKNISCWLLLVPLTNDYVLALRNKMNMWANDTGVSLSFDNFTINLGSWFSGALSNWAGVFALSVFLICLAVSATIMIKKGRIVHATFLASVSALFAVLYLSNSYFAQWYYPVVFAYSAFALAGPFLITTMVKKPLKNILYFMLLVLVFLVLLSSFAVVKQSADECTHCFLSTATPTILENYVPAGCKIITPYAPNVKMATSLNVISTFDLNSTSLTDYISKQATGCVYFFEDYLCEATFEQAGMKEDCDYIKEHFSLVPKLILKDSRTSLNYTLYRIYITPCLLFDRTKPDVIKVDY